MRKPAINIKPVANCYAKPGERIMEFSGKAGGGLIALRNLDGGATEVSVYRCDPGVVVTIPIVATLRAALARIAEIDRTLNDPHGDGSGIDSECPTGDSYNEVVAELQPLFDALGMVGPLTGAGG